MDRDVLDTIEREIDQEAKVRFPGTAVRQAVLLRYGDDPENRAGSPVGPGTAQRGRARGRLGTGPDSIRAGQRDGDRAVPGATWQKNSGRSARSNTPSPTTPSPAAARDRGRAIP